MENQKNKCSSNKHDNINANFYCRECKIYMCNKCEKLHSELFQNHHIIPLDKDKKDLFSGFCKEKNHFEKLEYFCKNHNQLCCTSCICRIEFNGKGQHSNCDVCLIEDIKEDKKNKMKENIKCLEDLSKILEESINEEKKIYEKINENKEKLKQIIKDMYKQIKKIIIKRKDEILLKVEKQFNILFIKNNNMIKEIEKLSNRIKIALQRCEIIQQNWDNNKYNLNLLVNNCIILENNIKDINIIKRNLQNSNNSIINMDIKNTFGKNKIYKFNKIIKSFGNIYYNNIFEDSIIIKKNKKYIDNIISWLDSKIILKTKILYRKTKDGDSYDIFHKLCDNQNNTLTLIKSTEGFIIGGYTPLTWDNTTYSWKYKDDETFLFSLINNKIFRKKHKSKGSIYCGKDAGPWFPYIGFRNSGKKNMNQVEFLYKLDDKDICFHNFNKIIPNEGKDRFFDVEEVEVFTLLLD